MEKHKMYENVFKQIFEKSFQQSWPTYHFERKLQ